MTLNGEMALILRYFTEFSNGPYFALFYRIRARCSRKTIIRFPSVSKSTFDSFDHINTIRAIIVRLFRQNKLFVLTCIMGLWVRCIDD